MSNESVSMRELELETAELLPSRETLNNCKWGYPSHGGTSVTNSFSQTGNGNNAGFGNVSVLNGSSVSILSGNNVLSGNHTNILGIL
jgi:hypothetical protein